MLRKQVNTPKIKSQLDALYQLAMLHNECQNLLAENKKHSLSHVNSHSGSILTGSLMKLQEVSSGRMLYWGRRICHQSHLQGYWQEPNRLFIKLPECFQNMDSPKVSRPKRKKVDIVPFYDLFSEDTHSFFCYLLFIRNKSQGSVYVHILILYF